MCFLFFFFQAQNNFVKNRLLFIDIWIVLVRIANRTKKIMKYTFCLNVVALKSVFAFNSPLTDRPRKPLFYVRLYAYCTHWDAWLLPCIKFELFKIFNTKLSQIRAYVYRLFNRQFGNRNYVQFDRFYVKTQAQRERK